MIRRLWKTRNFCCIKRQS